MADILFKVGNGFSKKYKDMGDGTYAEVVYAGGATIDASDLEIGAVEIKNDSDDTRAKVGAGVKDNGLRVTVATDDSLHDKLGEVQATPTANTLLRRLKDLLSLIVLAAGSARIGKVGFDVDIVGGNFTRPNDTTAYASGDLVANSTTAGSVVPITVTASLAADGKVLIPRVRLKKSGAVLTNASFRVHLYKASPTCTNGDNGAWLTTESTYIGAFDVTMDRAFSDAAKGTGVPLAGPFVTAEMASGTMTIFALIEARAAYTPAAQEVFTLACELIQAS